MAFDFRRDHPQAWELKYTCLQNPWHIFSYTWVNRNIDDSPEGRLRLKGFCFIIKIILM